MNVCKYVKSFSPPDTQKLGDASKTDKIIRNAGKLIASNSNQVIEYIESQVKSKVETKSPETTISINLLLVQSSTGVNLWSWYHPCRQIFTNRYGKIWYRVFRYTSIEISKVNDILEIGPHSSKTYDVANQILSMQNKSDQEMLKILKKCLYEEQSEDISAACIGGINSITSIFAVPPANDKLKSSNPQRILSNTSNQETKFSKPQNIEPQSIESQNIEPQIANTPDSTPGSSFDFVEPYEEVVEVPEFDADVQIASVSLFSFLHENEVGTPEHDSDEESVCYLNRLELIPSVQVNSVRVPDSTIPLLEPSEGTYPNILWFVKSFFTHNVEFIG